MVHVYDVTRTETVAIACKYCGSTNVVKYGKKGHVQYYLCRDCHHTSAGNDALPGMRTPPDRIGTALGLFYDGLSVDAIRRQLHNTYGIYPSGSTVYGWIVRFTQRAVTIANAFTAHVGDVWIADETVLKIGGENFRFWGIIDEDTRFLLASHMSRTRTIRDAKALMRKALASAERGPSIVITDKLAVYMDGIELVFGAAAEHIQSLGFTVQPNTNLMSGSTGH